MAALIWVIVGVLLLWCGAAWIAAIFVGRMVHTADVREGQSVPEPDLVDHR